MYYKLPFIFKTLALAILLTSKLGLIQSASGRYYKAEETYLGCNPFTCPTPPYPPGNKCTLVTTNITNPLTNTNITKTSTYMLTYNVPPPYTLSACQKIIPAARLDLFGCNSVGCMEDHMYETLVFCDYYNQEGCVKESGVREGETWRCGAGKWKKGPWMGESLCVCSPCGVAFKPVPLGVWVEEKAEVAVVVDNRGVSVIVL